MNQLVNIESMNTQPISKRDAEMLVADQNRVNYNYSFSHLHIALKSIKHNIDSENLPTVELANLTLEQEIDEDYFYVHRQKYSLTRDGVKKDVHTLLTYVCHKDQDYLITVARECNAHDPQDGFCDEYPIYNDCLKSLFKSISVFCNTNGIKETKLIFNTFFFKKLLENQFPETAKILNQNYELFSAFSLSNANNIVSNKGHFIAKNYLKHYKVIHDPSILTHTFNINSKILHELLESYNANDVMALNFKAYWCDFLNKRHQHRNQLSSHPNPLPTISELLLTAKKGKDLYRSIAQYISPHVLVGGKVIHLEINKTTEFVENWFKLNPDKKPTIEDLANFIFKYLEKANSFNKAGKKVAQPNQKNGKKNNGKSSVPYANTKNTQKKKQLKRKKGA